VLTNALLQDIGDAFAYTYRRGQVLNAEQKATVFINQMRKFAADIVQDWRIETAVDIRRQEVKPTARPDLGTDGPIP
jgi:hypothetical protein